MLYDNSPLHLHCFEHSFYVGVVLICNVLQLPWVSFHLVELLKVLIVLKLTVHAGESIVGLWNDQLPNAMVSVVP